ncbi:class I SAM-dependent methyltransferase [Dyella marensis]|uniref:Methyltransferase domain-containing protein n=1 Tax=Dyella marensis TaxID=500610 RepID=A0A1I2DEQ6_9GAMM|nr:MULTISPECIES: class I SAM-dependent methyltransferase [Dyella]SFE78430.1 Methyltransferase domain-containing protein [Dyella marensis]
MDPHSHRRIAACYDGRFQRGYVRGKLASDPVYAATADAIAGCNLPLLDIGCGIGLLGLYLHARGALPRYVGLDRDERKITQGRVAVRRAGIEHAIELHAADAAALPDLRGHVALLDMLHYLPRDAQATLLQAAIARLAPGGVLVIRSVLRDGSWRFQATRAEEVWLRVSGLIRGGAQHYPSTEELRPPLEAAGLAVSMGPLFGRTPFNSYLLVARRPRQAAA